jgi:hypothetical protein
MTETLERISGLLHETGETHHRVFRIVDGADDDWASLSSIHCVNGDSSRRGDAKGAL